MPALKVLWPQIHPLPQDQYTCRQCYSPICPSCANRPCRHFEKWLEAIEGRAGLWRSTLERLAELAQMADQKPRVADDTRNYPLDISTKG